MDKIPCVQNIVEYAAMHGVQIEEEENKIIKRLRHENERLREMCRLLTKSNNDLFEINRTQFDILTREIVENG